MISMTNLAGRSMTAAALDVRGLSMPCFETSGLSFVGAGVDATRVSVAAEVTVVDAAAALGRNGLGGNGFGAPEARRVERPLSASVAIMSAWIGGYGDATDAGTGAAKKQQSLQHKHELQTQKIAASATKIRALRGPDHWTDRT